MKGLRRWWLELGHAVNDINCTLWDGVHFGGVCSPCREDGGYVARRHADTSPRSSAASPSRPERLPDHNDDPS